MLWPSRDLQASSRSKDAKGQSRGPKRHRRNAKLSDFAPAAAPLSLESLEGRRVLAVTASVNAGVLLISMDAADDQAVLSYDGTDYTVEDGGGNTITTVSAAGITNSITVRGDSQPRQTFSFAPSSSPLDRTLIVESSVEDALINNEINGAASVNVDATTIYLNANVTTTFAQHYTGALTLSNDTTLAGTTVTNSSTITGGGKSLTITGNAAVNGAISGVTNYSVSGTTTLGANVTTTGTQTYTGLVTLSGDAALQGTTPTFSAGVTGAGKNLTLDFSGDTTVDGAKITGVKNLATGNGGSTQLTGTITTTGTQSYGDNVTLTGDTTLLSGANAILFSGTVNSQPDGAFGLTVINTSTTTFTLAVGGVNRLASLTGSAGGTIAVNGGAVTTSGNQAYAGTLQLGANTTLSGLMGTFTTINGNNYSLTLNFTNPVNLAGVAINNVSSLNVNSSVTLSGTITAAGNVSFGAVTLVGDTTLNAGAFNVTFLGTVNGGFGLTVNSAGTTAFGGSVGALNSLASLTTDAGGITTIAGGSITTSGAQSFGDTQVKLQANTTLSGRGQTFAGTLDANNNDLVLAIDSTGISKLDGNDVANLASLTTSGAGTLQVKGPLTSTGPQFFGSKVSLADDTTLDAAAANITFNAAVDGGKNLVLATTGLTTFSAPVGGVTPLASLVTSASGATAVNGGTIKTTGDQSYRAGVTFGAATTLSAAAITFADDADAAANALTATATSGAITASTLNKAISAGTLTLSAATGIDVNTAVTSLDAKVTGTGDIQVIETNDITLGSATGISTAGGTIDVVAASGRIQINKAIAAGTSAVTLIANDGITAVNGMTAITASDLDLTNLANNTIALPLVDILSLAVQQNAAATVSVINTGSLAIGVGTTGIVTNGSATIVANTGTITLDQPSSVAAAATLTFRSPAGIGQSASGTLSGLGAVDATTVSGIGGPVVLDAPGNTVANIQGATRAAPFTYVAGDDVSVGGIGTQGGAITLSAPTGAGITLAGGLAAGTGTVSISTATAAGGITSAGGSITTATATGDILITTSGGGAIQTPTITATGGDVTITTQAGGGIVVANALAAGGGNVAVQTVSGGAITSSATSITTNGAGGITLATGTSGSITTGIMTAGSGPIGLSTAGKGATINTTAGTITTAGGSVSASTGSGGDITLASVNTAGGNQSFTTGINGDFDSTAGALSSNGGTITATANGTGAITSGAISSNGGSIRLDAGSLGANAIKLQGDVSAQTTGRITLASNGGITDNAGAAKLTAGQLVIERSNDVVTLTKATNSIAALDLVNSSTQANRIVSGSPNLQIGIAGLATHPTPGITTASGDVSIAVGGGNNITALSNAVLTMGTGTLTVEALSITLDQQPHNVAFIAGDFAALDIRTSGTLTVTQGTKASDGTVVDGLRANGIGGGGGRIAITSGGGVAQSANAWIESQPVGLLTITANGDIDLPHASNKVRNVFFATPGDITYNDLDALIINGINGNTATKAADSRISAGGAITQTGAILSTNLRAGTNAGSVTLTNAGNNVAAFSAASGPSEAGAPVGVTYRDADDLAIGWVSGLGAPGITADGTPGDAGFIDVRVGGSILILDELVFDTQTPGSLVLQHGAGGTTTFEVQSPDNAGARTLRQRIDYLNANAVISPQSELITFNIDQFFPITITEELPAIERRVTIGPSAVTDPDLRIAIDGSGAAEGTNGLVFGFGNDQGLGSNNSLIQGLAIYGFAGSGIVLNSSGNTVTNCWVGITRGSEVKANGVGIDIESTAGAGTDKLASSNTITDNVISGNENAGIRLQSQATLNTITNNLIGTNSFGTVSIGNGGYGIEITDSNLNTIGGVGQGNTIVNNTAGGLKISGTLSSGTDFLANTILGNTIGNNSGNGIEIETSIGNTIGSAGAGNTIQDNTGAGISITGARATSLAAGNIVQANTISLNDLGGITLENAAFQTISGGNAIMSNGLFVANTGAGIAVRSTKANSLATNNVIVGNFIGTDSSGAVDGGNADAGILLTGAVNTNIGTATAGDGNVVSFNRRDGIRITNGDEGGNSLLASGNRLRGNTIRFNSSLGKEGQAGVSISGGKQNAVGGTTPGEGNVISDNNAHGVLLSAGANTAHAEGNRVAGNTVHANELDGISVSNSDFDSIDGGNVITASGRDGMSLVLASQSTRILGNRIGVDADGITAGNSRHGIFIEAATGITIGDAAASGRNVIAGNGAGPDGGDGVHLLNGANDVAIRNNLVGLTPTGTVGANSLAGIRVAGTNAAAITGLVIGGSAPNEGNIVSGNGLSGIVLQETNAAIVRGNRIGTDIAGSLAIANGGDGIQIVAGTGNLIGGTAATAGNLISGNAGSGISVDGGADHEILGNRIGTTAEASAPLANLAHGIEVSGNDAAVTIGGLVAGSSNTIAGNAIDGIHIGDGKAVVLGNFIGTNAASAAGLGNAGDGIAVLAGEESDIGDGSANGRNVISGNAGRGVLLAGGSKATISGNFIGTNAAGTAALANGTPAAAQAGIRIAGATNATISLGNVVSGNSGNGIELEGAETVGTIIAGNRVGTNATGAAAIANGAAGIALVSAGAADEANRNVVGGLKAGDANLIAGNAAHGIAITNSTNALVAQNTIGLNASGSPLGNAGSGIAITFSTDIDVTYRNQIAGNTAHGVVVTGGSGNSIGADAEQVNPGLANGNTITRNKLDGIRIDGGATGTIVAANTIGGAGLGNGGRGITVLASSGNTIGGTLTIGEASIANGNSILANASDGIGIVNAVAENRIQGNTIRANLGRGILLDSSDSQVIGGDNEAQRNLVVLNKVHGIELRNDTDGNVVSGNLVGTNPSFAGGLGNMGAGIRVAGGSSQNNALTNNRVQSNTLGGIVLDGAVGNTVGGAVNGNTIVLNKVAGVSLIGNASLNTVSGNFIGTDASDNLLGNLGDGVSVQGSVGNTIGGLGEGEGNTIRSNQVGVNLVNAVAANLAAGNLVAGNEIDSNLREGIRLFASSFHTVGGELAGNKVSRNAGDGIALTVGSSSNLVQANTIGGADAIDANAGAGIHVLGSNSNALRSNTIGNNRANGIVVAGSATTVIGGIDAEAGNTIEANRGDGILLTDAATQTSVFGNAISLNTGHGISVQRSTGNALGVAESGNDITGNRLDGIFVSGVSASTVIQANAIGGAAAANGGAGIRVAGAFGTLIGGTLDGDGNTISDNTGPGIAIEAVASRTAAAATQVFGNTIENAGGVGIAITGSTNQIIGGSSAGQANTFTGNATGVQIAAGSTGTLVTGNEITGSTKHGITITSSTGNTVSDNSINDSTGDGILVTQAAARTVAAGNRIINNTVTGSGEAGIRLATGTTFNAVGGIGLANTLAGNRIGLVIEGTASNNVVANNFIGTNADGEDVGNTAAGIEITGSLTNVLRSNEIAFNDDGIRIVGSLASTTSVGNKVLDNLIRDNAGHGIEIVGGGRSIVGTAAAGTGNVIISNGGDGISIIADKNGVGSVGNLIRGNFIGTDTTGAALGNDGDGISIAGGSRNEISFGNVISNNTKNGVRVSAATLSTIGGPTAIAGNTISDNKLNGVLLEGGSTSSTVAGNTLSGNLEAGVAISGSSTINNVIGMRVIGGAASGRGNTITNNQGGGVVVDAALRNQVFANFISANADGATTGPAAGIVLRNGGNGNAAAPTLATATVVGRSLSLTGTIANAARGATYWLDVFSNGTSGTPQANQPLGRVSVRIGLDGAFTATLRLPPGTFIPAGDQITATATDRFGNTSPISAARVVA